MTTDTQAYIPLSEVLIGENLPQPVLDIIGPVADQVAYLESSILGDANSGVITAKLQVISELALDLPFVKDLALVVGGGPIELRRNPVPPGRVPLRTRSSLLHLVPR